MDSKIISAKSQYELLARRAPNMRSDRQLARLYDFDEEYRETMADFQDDSAG